MKKRFALTLIIAISSFISVKSQSVLGEFRLPVGNIKNINSFLIGDTILLSVDITDVTHNVDAKRFFQINPDGSSQHFSTTIIGDVPLCSISLYDSSYYLYYFTGKRKNLVLKAMTYNPKMDEQKLLNDEIEINGELIGSWNDGTLSLILYDKDTNRIRVTQISKMEVKSEKVFDLPINLKEHYQGLTFIPESRFTSIEQGSAKFKLYKINEKLILTVDYTLAEGSSVSQTKVMTIDIESGTHTLQQFPDNTLSYFRSFVHNNTLYRTSISKNDYVLRVNDLATGTLLSERKMKRDTAFKESYVYRRIGEDFRIIHKETLYNMMKISSVCLPSVIASTEDSCSTSLIWGTYYYPKGGVSAPAGFASNPLGGILTMVIGTAIKQMHEPPGVSRYFYLENICDQPHHFKENTTTSLRQQIDDYEISFDLKRIFSDYKGYFDYQNGGVGVYLGHREDKNKLSVIKFERKKVSASN